MEGRSISPCTDSGQSAVLNVGMNHVLCVLDRVTNHLDHNSVTGSVSNVDLGIRKLCFICGSPALQSLNVATLQIVCQVYW